MTATGFFVAAALCALAQEGAAPAGSDPAATGAMAKPYAGVNPGLEARNPLPMPSHDPPRLVWTGFKMSGDRSQVFLQTTRRVTYDVRTDPGGKAGALELTVFLRNCRIHLRNNGRRLDTRFFATPVAEVSARQRRKDVELRILLKEPTTPAPRVEQGPAGSEFLVLEFPPGRAAPSPAEPAAAPAAGEPAAAAAAEPTAAAGEPVAP
jgi:hypothetical protein